MFASLEASLLSLVESIPLEAFVFVASIVEEVVMPIPSPAVMILTGSFALQEGRGMLALIPLLLLGTLGKTLGALLVYLIADKAEDIILGKWSNYVGVTRADAENLRARIGTGLRGYVSLTILRALPFVPSSLLSVGSGFIKVPLRLFLVATVLGTLVRDGFYLLAGYAGTEMLIAFVGGSETLEGWIQTGAVLALIAFVFFRLRQRNT